MVDKVAKRNTYDLTHFDFNVGRIGRLQTLAMVPVVAGDSFELRMEGVFRLSPLRRYLQMDCMVDLCAFFVPHRHCYGEDWIDFIKQGIDENITFPTADHPVQRHPGLLITPHLQCIGHHAFSTSRKLPKWWPFAYNHIWNRYFRNPPFAELDLDNADALALIGDVAKISAAGIPPRLDAATAERQIKYGYVGCLPKKPWTTGSRGVDAADREVSIESNKLDILELSRVEARYRTEILREWFAQRYNDVLEMTWDSQVNIDADERPELVMRSTQYLSGYDVDGTADETLGSYSGKSAGIIRFSHPRKYFPEHGSYWIVALVRFPLVTYSESHPLVGTPQPSYKDIAADPELWMKEPPQKVHPWDTGSTASAISDDFYVPYGQWYRYHNSRAHVDYRALQGFPILGEGNATSFPNYSELGAGNPYYLDYVNTPSNQRYDNMFQTTQLQHWTSQMRIGLMAHRFVPGPKTSIFAGAD